LQKIWLYGTGDLHITFTWRGGSSPMKYGGKFAGLIAELTEKYRNYNRFETRAAGRIYGPAPLQVAMASDSTRKRETSG
jgi:hypothetical protein